MNKITTTMALLLISSVIFAQTTVGLVAYFPMNGNITDAGPNAIVSNNFGATPTTNRVGTANSAMNFANPVAPVAQYATHNVNSNTSFGTAQNFTIAFACYFNSPLNRAGGLYDNNLNYGGPGLFAWNSNGFLQINFNFKNGNIGTTNGALTYGVWKHVAAVHSSGVIRIYINGVLNVTGSVGTTAPVYSFPARMGTMFFNGFAPPQYNGFEGKLDELRLYNRALTAAEILGLSSSALPIKLTNFTAVQKNNDVWVQWQTASETNSKEFLIQRSPDGINFVNAGSVLAKGNSTTKTNYDYTDAAIVSTINKPVVYYRLQSVDIDSKYQNSEVVPVSLATKTNTVRCLENPVKNDIRLQFNMAQQQHVNIGITNRLGQQIKAVYQLLPGGQSTVAIPVQNLTKGIYYVTIQYNNTKQSISILKD